MPTPSPTRASLQQPLTQPSSRAQSPQPLCPEDYHQPAVSPIAMNMDDSAASPVSLASPPAVTQLSFSFHGPVPATSRSDDGNASDFQPPSTTPTSPPRASHSGYAGSPSPSEYRSTTASPHLHSRGNSAESLSSDSNTAITNTPYNDDEPKSADMEERFPAVSSSDSRLRVGHAREQMDIGEGALPGGSSRRDSSIVMKAHWNEYNSCSPALTHGFVSRRMVPTTSSSYLRPGSRFKGTQKSERSEYNVDVEIKHVDMRDSFLCGYLHIEGLTPDNPSICTYFEGEIIGPKYGFLTKHKCWGADERTDLSHWNKFDPFRPYAKSLKKGVVKDVDFSQKENIFMRWKEHFLVPDHRKSSIPGASFEGFYYICFNQVKGEVTGIYFHAKSEKFQQLDLQHIHNHFRCSSIEFR